MRPIDSIVDASNYVMFELGQPTHPYDLDRLAGHGLRVRAARAGEEVVTLDGVTRVLGTRPAKLDNPLAGSDCLICDAEDRPVGIGGVMGGQSSEITSEVSRVLLEVAWFLPVAVARTARWVGLRSEASVRFERGVDPDGMERAGLRFCELVVAAARAAGVAPPVIASGLLDANPVPYVPRRIRVRAERLAHFSERRFSDDEIAAVAATARLRREQAWFIAREPGGLAGAAGAAGNIAASRPARLPGMCWSSRSHHSGPMSAGKSTWLRRSRGESATRSCRPPTDDRRSSVG